MIDGFEWCGYHWISTMKGRRIHPDYSYQWYSADGVILNKNNELEFMISDVPNVIHYKDKYYQASIRTPIIRSIEAFDYGTISAEVMFPMGYNLWPSFWMTGDGNWPPELDFEAWSEDNDYFHWWIPQPPYLQRSWRVTSNLHYNNKSMEKDAIGSRNIPYRKLKKDPSEEFVRYEFYWAPNYVAFSVDNVIVREVSGKICEFLTNNIKDKDKGYLMNVIFNVWTMDPKRATIRQYSPMKIRNFEYERL